MSDVLDQSEIDALLNAVADGDISGEEAGAQSDAAAAKEKKVEIRTYDFKRPERVSKDQMRALEGLHESFSRNLGVALSGYLRTIIEVKIRSVEQLTYAEFTYSLPTPTSFSLLSVAPLDGQMCLEVSPLIIYPIIDRMLGGSNAELYIPQRPLTQIEQRLANRIIERALEALTEAWENVVEIDFKVQQNESNPQLVQIVPPNEVVVVISFEIKMGSRAGSMSLCIPFNVIEPVIHNLTSQSWLSFKRSSTVKDQTEALQENIGEAKLKMRAYLAETTLKVDELLNMEIGDIIKTKKEVTDDLILQIEGKNKFTGKIGQFRTHKALRLVREAEPGEKI